MYDIHQHNLVFLALLYTQSQFVEHLQELIKQEKKCKLNMFHFNKSSVYLPIGILKNSKQNGIRRVTKEI